MESGSEEPESESSISEPSSVLHAPVVLHVPDSIDKSSSYHPWVVRMTYYRMLGTNAPCSTSSALPYFLEFD